MVLASSVQINPTGVRLNVHSKTLVENPITRSLSWKKDQRNLSQNMWINRLTRVRNAWYQANSSGSMQLAYMK